MKAKDRIAAMHLGLSEINARSVAAPDMAGDFSLELLEQLEHTDNLLWIGCCKELKCGLRFYAAIGSKQPGKIENVRNRRSL